MKITREQVVAAFHTAKRVYQGEIKRVDGINELVVAHGLNQATAGAFIYDYRQLVEGKEFHRAMSSKAMRYFLEQIEIDQGAKGLLNAVTSLKAHISYYEKVAKTTMRSLRSVAADAESRLSLLNTKEELEAQFEFRVAQSSLDSSAMRKQRLADADMKPKLVTVKTSVFLRNPDVVAEVLLRADGVCEQCGQPAPFCRAKDGTPYLEVHHVIQLSQGGDDSVKNAVALCPNCHRKAHFGISE